MKKVMECTKNNVFLKYNNLIIDTTYRQFFTNFKNNAISKYFYYLYNTLPPFFIGYRYIFGI